MFILNISGQTRLIKYKKIFFFGQSFSGEIIFSNKAKIKNETNAFIRIMDSFRAQLNKTKVAAYTDLCNLYLNLFLTYKFKNHYRPS